MIDRRALLGAIPALLIAPPSAGASPSPQARKLANRLELWQSFTRHTKTLTARLSTRRETSLLSEPLLSAGILVFVAPSRLMLRDDGRLGSTTLIDGDEIRIFLNARGPTHPSATVANTQPAARWLGTRLRTLFAPGDGTALLDHCRTHIPKGRGYRLELMPPLGSAPRRQIRSVSLQLDPVTGAITQLTITEAQGDRVVITLSDHRQNLPDADIAAALEP